MRPFVALAATMLALAAPAAAQAEIPVTSSLPENGGTVQGARGVAIDFWSPTGQLGLSVDVSTDPAFPSYAFVDELRAFETAQGMYTANVNPSSDWTVTPRNYYWRVENGRDTSAVFSFTVSASNPGPTYAECVGYTVNIRNLNRRIRSLVRAYDRATSRHKRRIYSRRIRSLKRQRAHWYRLQQNC